MIFNFENAQDLIEIDDELVTLLEKVALYTLEERGFSADVEVDMTIVSKEEIKALNNEMRAKDAVTDVLSFPMLDFEEPLKVASPFIEEETILGDIVICAERAKEQAEEYGHSFTREMAFLTVHSMLHLLGYDHETGKEDEEIMFALQDKILNDLNITR